jgi:glycogen(starch) synthase
VSAPLRVLLVTDAFPPVCGGSGWSTFELARGLVARGHHVEVVKVDTTQDTAVVNTTVEGLPVTEYRSKATTIPFVRNIEKNERLWSALARFLRGRLTDGRFDLVHGQHAMTAVPSINAARDVGIPSVATVRDYWPVCYWADLIYDASQPNLCPACTVGMMTECVKPRAGAAYAAAWPMIPYMRRNLQTKRRTLARAGAIIVPSHAIARDLKARAPEVAATPLYTIPNPVDMTRIDDLYRSAAVTLPIPYVLYAGKLATNKGAQFLLPAYADAGIDWPLVVIGDGPLRAEIEADAARRDIPVRMLGWLDREETLRWMRHAGVLAFPSYGPESLSRVLIEASALGVPIAAMDTGGTRDIVHPGLTGLLSTDPAGLARDLRTLVSDERLRESLGAQARVEAHARFSAGSVVERIEHVYRGLLLPRAA